MDKLDTLKNKHRWFWDFFETEIQNNLLKVKKITEKENPDLIKQINRILVGTAKARKHRVSSSSLAVAVSMSRSPKQYILPVKRNVPRNKSISCNKIIQKTMRYLSLSADDTGEDQEYYVKNVLNCLAIIKFLKENITSKTSACITNETLVAILLKYLHYRTPLADTQPELINDLRLRLNQKDEAAIDKKLMKREERVLNIEDMAHHVDNLLGCKKGRRRGVSHAIELYINKNEEFLSKPYIKNKKKDPDWRKKAAAKLRKQYDKLKKCEAMFSNTFPNKKRQIFSSKSGDFGNSLPPPESCKEYVELFRKNGYNEVN